MKAFVNTEVTKPQILKKLRAHAKADELVQGYGYWNDGKGCAVGCTVHSDDHAAYETQFGIPRMLAWLEDTIFEGLPVGEARKWPVAFMSAIEPGADLSCVGWQFLHWLLTDDKVNPGINHPLVRDAIKKCADILVPLTNGKPIDVSAESAESAARSAARSAAWSAWSAWSAESAESAARSAAWSAAESAESAAWSARSARSAAWSAAESAESAAWSAESAESAARSAADSAAWSARSARSARAARSAAYIKMSKKLLQLLRKAKS